MSQKKAANATSALKATKATKQKPDPAPAVPHRDAVADTSETVVSLRAKAKSRGLAGYSRLSKAQLIERINAGK